MASFGMPSAFNGDGADTVITGPVTNQLVPPDYVPPPKSAFNRSNVGLVAAVSMAVYEKVVNKRPPLACALRGAAAGALAYGAMYVIGK